MTFPEIQLPEEIQQINSSLFTSSSETLFQILGQWPRILVAIALIAIGMICMKMIRWGITKISHKFRLHRISDKIGLSSLLNKAQIQSSSSQVIAKFLYDVNRKQSWKEDKATLHQHYRQSLCAD